MLPLLPSAADTTRLGGTTRQPCRVLPPTTAKSRKQPGQVATTGAGGGPVHLAIFLLAAMRLGPAHAYGAIDTAVHRRKVDMSNQHDTTWQQGPRRHAEQGFGAPTRAFNTVNLADDREVLSIRFVAVEPEALPAGIARVGAQEQRRHSRIDEVIESTELRAMYRLATEHDLSTDPHEIEVGSVEILLRPLVAAEAGLADPPPGRS
jgi:hypothetical protein